MVDDNSSKCVTAVKCCVVHAANISHSKVQIRRNITPYFSTIRLVLLH